MGNIRSKGTITKWIDEKGFGFIKPNKDSKDVFAHISAFDNGIPRNPKVGDTVFYYVHTDKDGKTKAVDAIIEGVAPIVKNKTIRPQQQFKKHSQRSNWKLSVLCLFIAIVASGTIYKRFISNNGQVLPSAINFKNVFKNSQNTKQASSRYTCRGKTRCNQMSSCAEATFYIRNCPGTKMDGDGDGIPCESQWCN